MGLKKLEIKNSFRHFAFCFLHFAFDRAEQRKVFIHYRTKGIFLRKRDRGESNQLFTIFTKDFGRLEILGKAIRKITSKLRTGADIFSLSEIEFIQGKSHKTLTDAIPIDKFDVLKKSLRRFKIASSIAGILNSLLKEQEKDEAVWQLLEEVFNKLNARYKEKDTVYRVYYYFLWNFLSLSGYRPEIYNCVVCRKKLVPEKLYFSFQEGGVICNKCSKAIREKRIVTPELIKLLRAILKKDWNMLQKLKIDNSLQNSLKIISAGYFYFISEEAKNLL